MLGKMNRVFLGILVVAAIACTPKKKTDDQAAGEGGGDAGVISSDSMSFNAAGSDGGIQGLSTINFEYDSSTLSASAKSLLNENANWIKSHGKVTVEIQGHCDARGSVEYNLALGERRAKVVKDYLVGLGVSSKQLTIVSYGKEKLLALGDSEQVHQQNRRANFVPLSN